MYFLSDLSQVIFKADLTAGLLLSSTTLGFVFIVAQAS